MGCWIKICLLFALFSRTSCWRTLPHPCSEDDECLIPYTMNKAPLQLQFKITGGNWWMKLNMLDIHNGLKAFFQWNQGGVSIKGCNNSQFSPYRVAPVLDNSKGNVWTIVKTDRKLELYLEKVKVFSVNYEDCGKSWKEDNVIRTVVVDKFEGGGGNIISWKEGPFNFPLGVSTTLLSSQLYNTLLTVALSYLIAAALLCVFTELFYYYGDQCGGLYTACKKLNCHSLGHVVLSVSLLAVIVHAGTSMIDLSLYLDRVSSFEIADWQEAWSSSRVDIVAILLLLPLVVCTLFFVNGSAKICIGLSAAVVAAVLCASGYSINHGIQFTDLDTTFTISNNGSYMTSRARSNSSYESGVVRDTDSEDVKLSQFLHQLALVTSPLLVPALLSALSEDCKMKRHHALIAGIVTYVVTMLLHILFSLSISHITSSDDVYMDQLLLTIGVPQPLTIIMTVITSVTLYIRAVIILACGCRVMLGVAMFKEEDGLTGRFCTILRVPIVINTCIILLCAALVTSNGADVRALAMLLIFCFAMLGSVVQVLHRYILEEVTETTPIVGNFGSLKVQSTVRYLLAVLISAACFLWVSTLMDGILDHIYEVDMTWTVIQIFCVLAVVLCISIIASFKMATVEKPFRTIWTPTLPCVSIVICTFVIVTNWTYGLIMLGCIIILTVLVWVYDKLLRSCCCSVSVDNR